jgi:predicted porin
MLRSFTLLAGSIGVLTLAHAQSSVTLYGMADIGLAYQTRKTGSDNTVFRRTGATVGQLGLASGQQSGSRWGIKGTEAISSDLSANFVFESAADLTNGTSSGFTRQSTLGLVSKDWGVLDLGRRLSPGSYAFSELDPFNFGFDQASATASLGATFIRLSNMIAYSTPTVANVTGYVGWSFDTGLRAINSPEKPREFGTTNKFRALSTGVKYADDRLVAAGLFDVFYSPSGSGSYAVKQWNIGASYDLKIVKLYGAFGQSIDGRVNGTNVLSNVETSGGVTNTNGAVQFLQGARTTQWMAGLNIPISSASQIFGTVQQLIPGGAYRSDSRSTQTTASIGYTYMMSKRTNLYAYYSFMSAPDMYASANAQILGAGIRHQF